MNLQWLRMAFHLNIAARVKYATISITPFFIILAACCFNFHIMCHNYSEACLHAWGMSMYAI